MATTAATPVPPFTSRVRRQRLKTFRAVFPVDVTRGPNPAPGDSLSGPHRAPATSTTTTTTTVTTTITSSSTSSLLSSSLRANRSTPVTRSLAASASASAPSTPSGRHTASLRGQSSQQQQASVSADQLRWDQAWHTVTSRIQLPSSVSVEDSFGAIPPASQDRHLNPSFYEALALVLDPASALPQATQTEDILAWHGLQTQNHFVHHVLPLLAACPSEGLHGDVMIGMFTTLQAARRQYIYGQSLIVRGFRDQAAAHATMAGFSEDLQALVGSAWSTGLIHHVRGSLRKLLRVLLFLEPSTTEGHEESVKTSRDELDSTVSWLLEVGLAGEKFQVLFAEVMDACMQDFIKKTYGRRWTRPASGKRLLSGTAQTCSGHLARWINTCYGQLAVEVIRKVGGSVQWSDIERWHEIAIGRLATLRMHELFDITLDWPNSAGGIDDLVLTVTTPQRRLQLTDIFSAALQRRLLHPGISTLIILQSYISIIRTFHALDHSKVLLDRVVPALKLCLYMRDDAIRIVVTGLLANPAATDPDENSDKLVELAVILNEASQQQQLLPTVDDDLDWNNLGWVPDPVDAGANYRRPRNEDIIGTLVNALGLQDVFIKEFQVIVAERLLSKQPEFQQEIKVLGLLKKRFGDAALQNCDVMIKDIMDSTHVDATLGRSVLSDSSGGGGPGTTTEGCDSPQVPAFHAKILSRLFWPNLSKEQFALPAPVAAVKRRYEAGFEKLKSSRKLSWLDHLGSASVRLELQDRTVELQCKTYEAAVIYEFQDADADADADADHEPGPGPGPEPDNGRAKGKGKAKARANVPASPPAPQKRHFNDLWQKLMMDEDLLDSALRFWVLKRVLLDLGDQTYAVLENLADHDAYLNQRKNKNGNDERDDEPDNDDDDDTNDDAGDDKQQHAPGEQSHAPDAITTPRRNAAAKTDAKEQERRAVYWQFIVGMLTNSSPAMPLAQIGMMMKMMIADGCAWGDEELRGFLEEKVAGGELEFVGGKYRLLKK